MAPQLPPVKWGISKLFLISVILLSLNIFTLRGQHQRDTVIYIKRGSYVHMGDSLYYFKKDTALHVPSGFLLSGTRREGAKSSFYDSLRIRANKSLVARTLYDLVVIEPRDHGREKRISEDQFGNFDSLIIRDITIRQLDIFGTSVTDPEISKESSKLDILNSIHINTRESIIRRYLSFQKGESVGSANLAENERVLRSLPYVEDAMIVVVPVSELEAEILIVTKDKFSLGADLGLSSLTKGTVSLFERNIVGSGHSLELNLPFDFDASPLFGFGVTYDIRNFYQSFSDIELSFLDTPERRTYGIALKKDFLRLETKYSGGITIRDTYRREDLDTLPSPEPFRVNFQDFYLGRAVVLNTEKGSRLFLSARYTFNNVIDRPGILPDSYYTLQKYKLFLGSFTFSKRKFYKTSLIYSYGRTEDIASGLLVTWTGGFELNEFKRRGYAGVTFATGFYPRDFGYIYSSVSISSFLLEGQREQGLLNMKLNYFTNLATLGNFRLRGFMNLIYSHGYNRYSDEFLFLKSKTTGLRGFENDSLAGNDRLAVSLESVLFSPSNILGFRFAFFTYADIGIIAGRSDAYPARGNLYSVGAGVRIRNDNLVFNTFQLRLGYFFTPPPYSTLQYFGFSSEKTQAIYTFLPGPPSVVPYR